MLNGSNKCQALAYGLIAACCFIFEAIASPLIHTHTDTLELKPISSSQADFKTAAIYFLPDLEDNGYSDYSHINSDHNRGACEEKGYTYNSFNCSPPRILRNVCPFGNYYQGCYCEGSEACSGYTYHTSNPYPTSTGASENSCKDCGGKTLYSWQCSSSTCESYQISGSCPSNGNCSRCCDGYYKLNSCQDGYEMVGSGSSARCVFSETCFGEVEENSELGYSCSSCTNKSGQKLYTCSCSGSCNLPSCPYKGNCSTDCKAKYCLNSCDSGYSLSGNACVKDCVPNDCSSYPLYTPPANADYVSCSVGCGSSITRYRLVGCKIGYSISGNSCAPTPCPNGYSKSTTSCGNGYTLRPGIYASQIWSGEEKCRTCSCELNDTSCIDLGKDVLYALEATASCQKEDGLTYYRCERCDRSEGTAAGYSTCLANDGKSFQTNANPYGGQIICGGKKHYQYCGCESNNWKPYTNDVCGKSGYPSIGSGHKIYSKAGLDYQKYYHRGLYYKHCKDSGSAAASETYDGCALYYCARPDDTVVDAPMHTCAINNSLCCCAKGFAGIPNSTDCESTKSIAAYPDNQP